MNTRRFICGSSCILAGWLGATFIKDVPEAKYPRLEPTPKMAVSGKPVSRALASRVDDHDGALR